MTIKPLVTAHTGCNNTPYNTLESILTGAELGADINEVDVRATGDLVPILWHDSHVNIRGTGPVSIESITYNNIESMINRGEIVLPGNQSSIIRLEEVFKTVKDRNILLNLDLKDDECIIPVAEMVRAYELVDSVICSGCEQKRAALLKSRYPEFQVLLNVDDKLINRKDLSYMDKIRILCSTAVNSACCGINIPYDFCSPELIEYADLRFLPVVVWTVAPEDKFETFIDMGVFSINTLHVKELIEVKQGKLSG